MQGKAVNNFETYQDPEEKCHLKRVLEQDEMDQMEDGPRVAKPKVLLAWLRPGVS